MKLWAFGAEVPAQENRIGKKKQVDTALRSFYRLPWLRGYYHLQFVVDVDKLLVELQLEAARDLSKSILSQYVEIKFKDTTMIPGSRRKLNC